ncbi:MAG: carboxypeptidase regulatory-like domain-containing protein [Acidobacteria bacterium]|nr:carboxypeptidase regulatory-like domain-containing protein [Acidobacteriota bacterium]
MKKMRNEKAGEKTAIRTAGSGKMRRAVSALLIAAILGGALAFDPEIFRVRAQSGCGGPDAIFQNCALGGGQIETDLTNQAVDDVIEMYRLPGVDRGVILQNMRSEVRGMLYVRLLELIKKPNKTAAETQAVAAFADRVKQLRVRAATEARNEYQRWQQNACGDYQPPAPYTYESPGCTFYTLVLNGAPTSPSFEEFEQFGAAIAYQGLYTPEAEAVTRKTSLTVTAATSAAAAGIGGGIGAVIGSTVTFGTLEAVFPGIAYVFSSNYVVNELGLILSKIPIPAATPSGSVGATLAGGPVAVIITAISILVTQTINVVNQRQIPDKLDQAVVDAQNLNIDLNQMVATDVGNNELYGIFIFETLPDFPPPVAPAAQPTDRPFLIRQDGGGGEYEAQSFDGDLGWRDQYTTPVRLSGSLFAYSEAAGQPERLSILFRYRSWDGADMAAYRIGGQFFVMNANDLNSGRLTPYLELKSHGVRLTVSIKTTNMQLFETETVAVRCGLAVSPDPGSDRVIGRVTNAGEPASSLAVAVDGGATATVNGITVRSLRVNADYEVVGNVLATNVPVPTTANFTLSVENGIGQQRTVPVTIKKTSVLNTLPSQNILDGELGTPFSIKLAEGVEIGCSNFDFSIDGDIPPGLGLETGLGGAFLRGTPTSGGKFIFRVTKRYANGESVSQTYYLLVRTSLARIDDSVLSWWRAEDGAADQFGRADATVVGNVGYGTGKVNRGFNFDGGNSYVRLPDNTFSPGNSFTFETWFKTAGKGVILGRQQSADPYGSLNGAAPVIYVDHHGRLRVQMFKDRYDRFITSPQRVDDNQYHHVAVTYDWTTEIRRVYLDGAEVDSIVGGQLATASKYQFGAGYVADAANGGTNGWLNFAGVIDEPALYGRALGQTEIAAIFRAGTIGKLRLKIRPYPPQERNGGDGGLLIDAQGGSPPLKFKVTRGFPVTFGIVQDTSNFMSLTPADYDLTVTDSLGFEYTTPVTVPNAPPNLTVTATGEAPRCFGEQNGSLRVLINGNNSILIGGSQFSVFGGANWQGSNYFANLGGGTYTPAVFDVPSNSVHTGEPVTLAQPAPYALSPGGFPNAQQNVPYSQTFTLSGNNAPYTLTAEGSDIGTNYELPAGLSASVTPDSITIGGTPTVAGTFPIRFVYSDGRGCPGSRSMNLTINAAGSVSIAGRVTNGGQGLPNATVTLSGGANRTTTTDAAGNYSFAGVPQYLDYTATVALPGYSFAAPSLTFGGVGANIADADFATAFPHYEGDVAPRATGDGSVDVRDYVALSRIVGGQDGPPAAGGEWQRASIAPRSTLGSATLQGADLTQMLRYIVRENPLTLVGGPANLPAPIAAAKTGRRLPNDAPVPAKTADKPPVAEANNPFAPALVIAQTVTAQNNLANVPIFLNSDGGVTAAQFTVAYDNGKLALNSISSLDPNNLFVTNTNTPGKVNVVALRNGGGTFPTGAPLLRLNFTVLANATGSALVDFTDTPVPLLATDAAAGAVPLTGGAGRVLITVPTAAGVPISGRVLAADGRAVSRATVVLALPGGATRTARSNSFGYYRFEDVPAGETCVLTVEHKEYRFGAQVVTLADAVENLDFTALGEP